MDAKRMVFVLAMIWMVSPLAMVEAQPSVLGRVTTVDDPGLAECLRVAVENLQTPATSDEVKAFEDKRLETIKAVTESYAQIRLFDTQIEQIDKRLHTAPLPDGLSFELVTARAEMEMKRAMELAKLRLNMGVLPRYAFAQRPADQLKGWFELDVLDPNQVCFLRYRKPFRDYFPTSDREIVSLISADQVDRPISDLLAGKEILPSRITISSTREGYDRARQIYEQMVQLIKKAGAEMDVDIRLDPGVHEPSRRGLCVCAGQVGYGRPGPFKVRGRDEYGVANPIDPNRMDAELIDGLKRPSGLPIQRIIKHDPQGKDLAHGIATKIREIAGQLGISAIVEVSVKEVSDGKWE